MRFSIRSVLVALMAVMALSAVAASGASAYEFVVEGKPVTEAEPFTGSGGLTKITLEISGSLLKLECQKSTWSGDLEAGGQLRNKMVLEECAVISPAGCKLSAANENQIVFSTLTHMESLTELINRGVGSGEEFTAFQVEGYGCVFQFTVHLAGYFYSTIPSAGETEDNRHGEWATKGQSHLTFGGNGGTLSFTGTLSLVSGKTWWAAV